MQKKVDLSIKRSISWLISSKDDSSRYLRTFPNIVCFCTENELNVVFYILEKTIPKWKGKRKLGEKKEMIENKIGDIMKNFWKDSKSANRKEAFRLGK